jgi:hypothetical protein
MSEGIILIIHTAIIISVNVKIDLDEFVRVAVGWYYFRIVSNIGLWY